MPEPAPLNNIMRHQQRPLTDAEQAEILVLKDKALDLWHHLDRIGRKNADAPGSRELSLAKTHVEEAVMWGVKHITR